MLPPLIYFFARHTVCILGTRHRTTRRERRDEKEDEKEESPFYSVGKESASLFEMLSPPVTRDGLHGRERGSLPRKQNSSLSHDHDDDDGDDDGSAAVTLSCPDQRQDGYVFGLQEGLSEGGTPTLLLYPASLPWQQDKSLSLSLSFPGRRRRVEMKKTFKRWE